jgi:hypothetical protein
MMMHSFDIYAQLIEIGKELRKDLEMDAQDVVLSEASGGL